MRGNEMYLEIHLPVIQPVAFRNHTALTKAFEACLTCVDLSWTGTMGLTPGKAGQIEDDHVVYHVNLPQARWGEFVVLLGTLRRLLQQNTLYVSPDEQLNESVTNVFRELSLDRLQNTMVNKDMGYGAESYEALTATYDDECVLILDDAAVFCANIAPPIEVWTRGSRYTSLVRSDLSASVGLLDFLRGRVPKANRTLPPKIAEEVLRRGWQGVAKNLGLFRGYGRNGDVVDDSGAVLLELPLALSDQLQWALRAVDEEGRARRFTRIPPDQDLLLQFLPTTYLVNKSLERVMHPTLAQRYTSRGDESLNFARDTLNRAVSQVTVVTKDNFIVMAKRSEGQGYFAGAWDATLGEALQPIRVRSTGVVGADSWVKGDECLAEGAKWAVTEELKLNEKNVERIAVTGIGREWSNGNLAVFSTVWLSCDWASLAKELRTKVEETSALAPMPLKKVLTCIREPSFDPKSNEVIWVGQKTDLPADRLHGCARVKLLLTLLAAGWREVERAV